MSHDPIKIAQSFRERGMYCEMYPDEYLTDAQKLECLGRIDWCAPPGTEFLRLRERFIEAAVESIMQSAEVEHV